MEPKHHQDIYTDLMGLALQEFKGFRVRYKDQSLLMKVFNWVLGVFNPTFMTNYTTVVGNTVYFPSKFYVVRDYHRAWRILAHEMVHMEDRKRNPGFGLLYLFPQVLFPVCLALFLVLGLHWWSLLSLLFLAPLPAPFRMHAEAKAYAMTLATGYWITGQASDFHKNQILREFSGPGYYFMWPFRSHARKVLDAYFSQVLSKRVFSRSSMRMFREVFSVLERQGVVAAEN